MSSKSNFSNIVTVITGELEFVIRRMLNDQFATHLASHLGLPLSKVNEAISSYKYMEPKSGGEPSTAPNTPVADVPKKKGKATTPESEEETFKKVEAPKKKGKAPVVEEDEPEPEVAPKKKGKAPVVEEEPEPEVAPKKKGKAPVVEDVEPEKKKGKAPVVEEDDEAEVEKKKGKAADGCCRLKSGPEGKKLPCGTKVKVTLEGKGYCSACAEIVKSQAPKAELPKTKKEGFKCTPCVIKGVTYRRDIQHNILFNDENEAMGVYNELNKKEFLPITEDLIKIIQTNNYYVHEDAPIQKGKPKKPVVDLNASVSDISDVPEDEKKNTGAYGSDDESDAESDDE